MRWIYLNHILSSNSPLYKEDGKIQIRPVRAIKNGDSSNNSELSFPAHSGTHIDAPFHFDDHGLKLDEYPADYWIASRVSLLDFPCKPGHILRLAEVKKQLASLDPETDFLIVRTGAELWRTKKYDAFCFHGVGIAFDLAQWLRLNLNLKFLGTDAISVSSPANSVEGRKAHCALLANNDSGKPPVLLVEDMALAQLSTAPLEVVIAPLLYEGADGSPVTVLAHVL